MDVNTTDPRGRDPSRFDPLEYLGLFLLLWTGFSLVQTALFFTVPGTAWGHHQLTLGMRLSLLGLEVVALTGVALVAVIPLLVDQELVERRRAAVPPLVRLAARGATVLAVWPIVLLYAASWAAFRSTGQFLTVGGLAFGMINPIQLLQHVAHMEPYTLVTVPVVSLGVAGLVVVVLPPVVARLKTRVVKGFVAGLGGVLILSGIVAWRGGSAAKTAYWPVTDPTVGMIYTMHDLYETVREERAGPATHFVADLARRLSSPPIPLPRDVEIETVRRPIIAMDEYLAGVDRDRIDRWNVIILVVESLRNDQLRLYGGPRVVMPAVEELARNGRVFTNHYTQSSHSNYADMAPLSSHYPLRSPNYHVYPEDPGYPRVLIYDVLKALGYRVAVFSSQDENWGGMINYLRTGSIDRFLHAANFEGPTYVPRGDHGFEKFIRGSKRSGKIDDRFTVGEAMAWIDERREQPFFIYMNLQSSHVPYETPADFQPPFGPRKVSFPVRFGWFPPDSVDVVKDLYSNSLAYVDSHIARLFQHLRSAGLWDRTVVVVTGDTGQGFFEHGFAAHANALFNEVMQVPLIIRAPGLEHAVDDRPAQHIDVPPSVFHLLGLPAHPSFQGNNLFAPSPPQERSLFLVAQAPLAHQYAIVRSGFKLIYDVRYRRHLLYDLERDPGETTDLSPEMPRVVRELAARLHAWRKIQLEYYQSPHLHRRWYPPILTD